MAIPSANDFRELIRGKPLEDVVQACVFGEETFFFQDRPDELLKAKSFLCSKLTLSTRDVTIIGSAKLGYTLDPENFPRPFSDASDIDILIVSAEMFDKVWMSLIKWHFRRGRRLGQADLSWATSRKEDVFWGWFSPDKIRYRDLLIPNDPALAPMKELSAHWFNVFKQLSRRDEFQGRDVTGRLYRSWDHALRYHVHGLERIKNRIFPR